MESQRNEFHPCSLKSWASSCLYTDVLNLSVALTLPFEWLPSSLQGEPNVQVCSHKLPNIKCQRIRPSDVQKLSPTHISLLLPIPCQNPSASAWLCYLCLVMICCSVVRDIGKQHEFTWKKLGFAFFFLLSRFFPLFCSVQLSWYCLVTLPAFYPSVQTKHAENERQHVTFWSH